MSTLAGRVRWRPAFLVVAPVTLCMLSLAPSPAQAQAQGPARGFNGLFAGGPPPDPNRTSEQLTLTGSLFGGWDENAAALTLDRPDPTRPLFAESGYTGVAHAALRYWRGRQSRSFLVEGRVGGATYSTLEGWQPEGGVRIEGTTQAGRRTTLTGRAGAAYEPYYTLGGFGPLSPALGPGGVPATGVSYGILEYASWLYDAGASVSRRWSRSQTTTLGYSYAARQYSEGPLGDFTTNRASVDHDIAVSSTVSLRGSYGYSRSDYDLPPQDERPLDTHDMTGAVLYQRRLSPRRSLVLSAGGGASYADTVDYLTDESVEIWKPTYFASARIDLGRTWALWGDYRRSFNVLNALNYQTYYSDVASMTVGGYLGQRTDVSFSAGYADGSPTYGLGLQTYETYTATAQVRFALARYAALMGRYYYYFYDFARPLLLPPGLPGRYDRQGVQAGLTMWLPLVGRFQQVGR